MATTSTKESTSAEIAKQITFLLKESPDDRHDAARLDELRKIFAKLLQSGDFTLNATIQQRNNESAVKEKWRNFLLQNHKQFIHQLCERILLGKRTAMRTLWGVVATSPVASANGKYQLLSTDLLVQWIRAMTRVEDWDKSVRHMVLEFLGPYRDVQYYSMIAVLQFATELYQQKLVDVENNNRSNKSSSNREIAERAERLVEFLMMIPISASQKELRKDGALFAPPEGAVPDEETQGNNSDESSNDSDKSFDSDDEEEEERPPKRTKRMDARPKNQRFTFEQLHCHHRAWAKAWLAVLRLDLPVQALKNVLRFLPDNVLPLVPAPLRFADFFMQAYDCTGIVPVLALDGLFLLMTHHRLEYPNFYKQLYKLVTPSLLYVKYRTRFFRLLDKCLSRNEMLPAYVVAAFVKRLMRCTMTGPPSSTLFVLALCSNLLRKHPEVACLVHRASKTSNKKDSNEQSSLLLQDQFDADTDDPEQSNALQSSLWELGVLEKHYYPAVVTLAKSIGREDQLVTPLYNLEDFLAHTYQSLFDQERKRRLRKGKTPLAFIEPKSLFVESDVFADMLAKQE